MNAPQNTSEYWKATVVEETTVETTTLHLAPYRLPSPGVCPNCGRCPTCGHTPWYYPPYPYVHFTPTPQFTYTNTPSEAILC